MKEILLTGKEMAFLVLLYFHGFAHSVNISGDFEHPLKFYGIFVK